MICDSETFYLYVVILGCNEVGTRKSKLISIIFFCYNVQCTQYLKIIFPKLVYTYVYFFIAELLLLTQVPQDNPIMEMKKVNDNCAICQYAMETLYTILENKDNQDEIRNTLDTLCEYMPSSISKPCEEYVDAYAETVIQLILQDFTPQQICAEIGLCTSVSEVVMTVQDTKCVL